MNIKTFIKFEPNNKRGIVKSCEICSKQFGFLKQKQHQCKRCFRAICEECGKIKRDVYKIGMVKTPHRLCTICTKESDFIRNYISVNQLKFGQDCTIAKKWLKRIPEMALEEDNFQINSPKQITKLSFEIFNEMWDAYNFSMRQFIGLMTFDRNQKDIYKLVCLVYDEIQQSLYDGKLQYILFVIIFMLCFGSSSTCIKVIQQLLKLKQSVIDNKSLLQTYLKALGVNESELKKINEYTTPKLKQFLNTFSINSLTVECSLHLFSRLLQKSKIEEVHMLFAIIVQDNLKYIFKNKNSKIDCDIELIRNCKLQLYAQKYRFFATIKIPQYIFSPKSNSENMTKDTNHNNEKNIYLQDDAISSKTKSYKDDQLNESLNYKDFSRKTQKAIVINPNILTKKKKLGNQQNEQCLQCDQKKKIIQQLQMRLIMKDKQLEGLNFKLNFRRKQSSDDFEVHSMSLGQSSQIIKGERKGSMKTQRTDSIVHELSRLQRQNTSLKNQMAEMQISNKMLKNRLQSSDFAARTSSLSIGQNSQGQGKVIQVLQKKLQQKNKMLEQQFKKNKLLSYQVEQRASELNSDRSTSEINEQKYLQKIRQLTKILNEEQLQKIMISEQLFDLKETLKGENSHPPTSTTSGRKSSKNHKQCAIF